MASVESSPDDVEGATALAPEPEQPVAPPVPKLRGRAGWLVLGGVISAVLGYSLAQVIPSGWPISVNDAQLAALQAQVEAQSAATAKLTADLDLVSNGLAPVPGDVDGLKTAVTALKADFSAQTAELGAIQTDQASNLAALAAKIGDLASGPAATGAASGAENAALRADLNALRTMIDAQQGGGTELIAQVAAARAQLEAAGAQAQELQSRLEMATSGAIIRSALLRISAALDAGGPFGAALEDVAATGLKVPQTLTAVADGVPTLQDLQAGYPEPARLALAASLKATAGDTVMARLTAFMRIQIGARSLTEQAGTDPDAILSRATAALDRGDVSTAVAEIGALPEPGKAAMKDWLALVQTRIGAEAEIAALTATLDR